jgi:hypothetical protein
MLPRGLGLLSGLLIVVSGVYSWSQNTTPTSPTAAPQGKVELDDIDIKGETQSDGRLSLRSRSNLRIESELRPRVSLRSRILEDLPEGN